MVTKNDYGKSEVQACLDVLIEVMTILGECREDIVLIGGWIPYFLLKSSGDQHIGSLDIDLALDFKKISDDTYQTILQSLETRGYKQGKQPFIFHRTLADEDGKDITVEVDLLAGEYGGTGRSHRTQPVQDVRARKARGCDLAFVHNQRAKISGSMPDGSRNEVDIKIAGIIPFLVMKGIAIWERLKEKDAYDIYFSVLNYPGGHQKLCEIFNRYKENKLVREGIRKIKAKFKNLDAPGPVWTASFLDIGDQEEKERIQRDAFERVNAFLDALDVTEFEEKPD